MFISVYIISLYIMFGIFLKLFTLCLWVSCLQVCLLIMLFFIFLVSSLYVCLSVHACVCVHVCVCMRTCVCTCHSAQSEDSYWESSLSFHLEHSGNQIPMLLHALPTEPTQQPVINCQGGKSVLLTVFLFFVSGCSTHSFLVQV